MEGLGGSGLCRAIELYTVAASTNLMARSNLVSVYLEIPDLEMCQVISTLYGLPGTAQDIVGAGDTYRSILHDRYRDKKTLPCGPKQIIRMLKTQDWNRIRIIWMGFYSRNIFNVLPKTIVYYILSFDHVHPYSRPGFFF